MRISAINSAMYSPKKHETSPKAFEKNSVAFKGLTGATFGATAGTAAGTMLGSVLAPVTGGLSIVIGYYLGGALGGFAGHKIEEK